MRRISFVVPCHGREELTRVCLRQLLRTCEAVAKYDLSATAFVIGEGPILDFASSLGFGTVERDNTQLGRRFNDGYQVACDPTYNPQPADYVVPCGSDDWLDPVIFKTLPLNAIGVFRQIAVVNEDRTRISRLKVGYQGGAGIRVIPAEFIRQAGFRPCEEDRPRACDTSTLMGLSKALNWPVPRTVEMDVHPLQIVDWKSRGTQLNSYEMLRGYRRGDEADDPFTELAAVYPAEALEEMRTLA